MKCAEVSVLWEDTRVDHVYILRVYGNVVRFEEVADMIPDSKPSISCCRRGRVEEVAPERGRRFLAEHVLVGDGEIRRAVQPAEKLVNALYRIRRKLRRGSPPDRVSGCFR